MNQMVYQLIYGKPLNSIITAVIAGIFLWGIAAAFARKKSKVQRWWKRVNFCLTAMFVVFIIYFTVLSRQTNVSELQLIPFHSFVGFFLEVQKLTLTYNFLRLQNIP